MNWKLDKLYTSFEDENLKNDINSFFNDIENFKKWTLNELITKDNAKDKIEKYIDIVETYMSHLYKVMIYARLNLSVNTKNTEALKIIGKLEQKASELTEPSVKFQKWFFSLENIDKIIDSSNILKEYKFYLKKMYEEKKYILSEELEIIISKMSLTGSSSWEKLQELTTSTLMVDIDGETKQETLTNVRQMPFNKDKKIREKGYIGEMNAYPKIEEVSAACLNNIIGEAITVLKMRGYNSALERSLINYRMSEKALNSMYTAVKEVLPYFHKYYRKKAELLGYKNGLPYYEMFAPLGKMDKTFSYEETKEYIVKNFSKFSKKLSDFADNAFKNNWVDAQIVENKVGGAFCSNIYPIKESRVLTNFSNDFMSVKILAHELGHAYHGDCIFKEKMLNIRYTSPVAETASIFCETIIKNSALEDGTEEERFALLENIICDAGYQIVDIYSRFLFEKSFFEKREKNVLSVEEIKELMINAQKEAFGNGLDHKKLHPYMWICKTHYYSANHNFYNYPYTFGLLFAKGVYAEYLKKGDDFIPEYDKLLSITGKNDIADAAKTIGIDIENIEFWRNSVNMIKNDIEEFLKLSENK